MNNLYEHKDTYNTMQTMVEILTLNDLGSQIDHRLWENDHVLRNNRPENEHDSLISRIKAIKLQALTRVFLGVWSVSYKAW